MSTAFLFLGIFTIIVGWTATNLARTPNGATAGMVILTAGLIIDVVAALYRYG